MLKKIAPVIVLFFSVCVGSVAAQTQDYVQEMKKISEAVESLSSIMKSGLIEFGAYDSWYKGFKPLAAGFKESFLNSQKQSESFQEAKDALDGFSLAWGSLNQAKYAEEQYRESITLNQPQDAQKWKGQSSAERKKAAEMILRAIDALRDAYSDAQSGK